MKTGQFNPKEYNSKISNLKSNGFEEYLTVMEGKTEHIIMTNTKAGHKYNGWVVDIYSNGKIEYSNQFKTV